MSETKSIEERYKDVREYLSYYSVHDDDAQGSAIALLDDLMAERGEMRESVELDELFSAEVRHRADYYRAFDEMGGQLEGDKSLKRVCAYLLRAYDPQPFILKAHTFENGGDVEIAEICVRINPITVEIVED